MANSANEPTSLLVKMQSDCTIRSIEGAYEALRLARANGSILEIDCSAVEHADIAFAQLIVSAQTTFAASGVRLVVDGATPCVHAAFQRSGIPCPVSDQPRSP